MNRFKNFFAKLSVFLSAHSVGLFLLLLVFLFAAVGLIAYYYAYLAISAAPEAEVEKVTIGKELYRKIADDLNAREQYQLPEKEYKNPFR